MKRAVQISVALVLAGSFWTACTHRHALREPGSDSAPTEQFTVVTYNVLQGLEVGGWSVGAGESKEEQVKWFNLQARQLSLAQPDVMLLQEVNPLPDKAEAFVTALKTLGLQYIEVHQADACGIRLFGLRIVPGLNNGMAVLAKAPLRLRKVEGLKLSGGIGGCDDFFGLQFGELRYAGIAGVENPFTGNKFLAVSLHLHSGIERTAYFIRKATEAEKQGSIQREDLEDFVADLKQDQNRRLGEIRVLVTELRRLQAEETYLGVIVGGDFNLSPTPPSIESCWLRA